VPDLLFEDEYLASLYDVICTERDDEDFYLKLINSEHDVLDVGCGTGTLLHRARANGHRGRLLGIDPAAGMLTRAARYDDIEWRRTALPEAGFQDEFDLIIMTGHAFQVLLTDDAILEFLDAARRALNGHGRLAFESRNPLVRAWQRWTPDRVTELRDGNGALVRVWHEVEDVDGELVTFTETFEVGDERKISRSTIRFAHAEHLDALLRRAGLTVHERYGDWDRSPFTVSSPEIITVAASIGCSA
jgi:SAM-dependent methyltransferase